MSVTISEIIHSLSPSFSINDLVIYPTKREIHREDQIKMLEPRTMNLLCYLAFNNQRVCSREELTAAIWGDQFINKDSITRAISDLRKALGDDASNPVFIKTIPKQGYIFLQDISASQSEESKESSAILSRRTYSYAAAAFIGAILTTAGFFAWESTQKPIPKNKIVRWTVPVIVKDTVGVPDSVIHKKIEAVVDVAIDEMLNK